MAEWKWAYKIGDRIVDEKRNLEIIDREIREKVKRGHLCHLQWYKYKCHKCGYDEGWIYQSNLKNNKRGCSVCNGKTVAPGINDVATLYPEKVKYFLNKEDAKHYTTYSRKKVQTICPNCGDIREIRVSDLIRNELYPCYRCGDGISAPEKFVYAVLKECNIEFIRQLSSKHFEWCGKYRYDFYLVESKIVFEVDGAQHFLDKTSFNNYTHEEIYINDVKKIKNIIENGKADVKYIICMDASITSKEYLIDSIKKCGLFDELKIDPNTINFNKCFDYINKSMCVEIAEYFNNHKDKKIDDIAKYFKLDRHTITHYLRHATDIGICNYNYRKRGIKHAKEIGKRNSKKVNIITPTGEIFKFNSAKEAEDKSMELFGIQLSQDHINAVCRGVYKTTKGFRCYRESEEEK